MYGDHAYGHTMTTQTATATATHLHRWTWGETERVHVRRVVNGRAFVIWLEAPQRLSCWVDVATLESLTPAADPATLRFTKLPDPAAGCRAYLVLATGAPGTPDAILGTVTNRRGDWWRATTDAGQGCGSFHSTRRAAAAALQP